jgi:hypothetical protein
VVIEQEGKVGEDSGRKLRGWWWLNIEEERA